MKKVAVVILNWNGRKLLEQFLPFVLNYTPADIAKIIVADNCSDDDSVAFLSREYPQVRLINLSENFGYAGGYNNALKQVESEYVILLNSDVEVTENWLEPMISYLDANQDVAAIQPKILWQRDRQHFEYAGGAGGFIDKYGYPFCRGRIFTSIEKDNGQYNTPVNIFWASGACMVIRLSEFRDAGGFDQGFFAHMEEIDLCWRLNARGKQIVCLPQSTVFHVGGATLSEENPRKTFLNFRNNLLMLYKNLPEDRLNQVLRVRCLLDRIAALQMLFRFKYKNAKAVLCAIKEYKRMRPEYRHLRKENLRMTTNSDIKTIYPKSILYSYYIKGLKIFNNLKF